MGRFLKRPSPGTVIATIALFVALGGVAVALPGRNSVNNGDVKDLKFKGLTLKNGWDGGSFNTRSPAVAIDAQGVVHFKGAMSQSAGSNTNAFNLPAKYRQKQNKFLYVTVDMCDSSTGRLIINPNGTVNVQTDIDDHVAGADTDAQCFTSLEGASFSKK
jgi:hypothetical protein